jgi:hypothetical protein
MIIAVPLASLLTYTTRTCVMREAFGKVLAPLRHVGISP